MLPHVMWASRQRLEAGNWEKTNGTEKAFVILDKSQESPFISPGSALTLKIAL